MEQCKICEAPCKKCGYDPHDTRCGICGLIHPPDIGRLPDHMGGIPCGRCGRLVDPISFKFDVPDSDSDHPKVKTGQFTFDIIQKLNKIE